MARTDDVTDDRVVVSRRVLQEEGLEEWVSNFWRTSELGQVVEGTVVSVQSWGAFVDIGGVQGLRVRAPEAVFGHVDVRVGRSAEADVAASGWGAELGLPPLGVAVQDVISPVISRSWPEWGVCERRRGALPWLPW